MSTAANTNKRFPLDPFKRGMYIENRLHPDSGEYDLFFFCEINDIPAERIGAAFETVFRSHETFRCVYGSEGGDFFGELTDGLPVITVENVDDISAGYKAPELYREPYDLSEIPVKVVIYTDGRDSLAVMMCHHIVTDGSGETVFLNSLLAALTGREPEKCTYDITSAALEDREEEYAKGFELIGEQFAEGVPESELPLKRSRPEAHPLSDRVYDFTVEGDRFAAVKNAAVRCGTTSLCMLLSAYSLAAAKYTGSEDIIVTVPANTRSEAAASAVGMFINSVPMRLRPVRSKTAGEYTAEVSTTVTRYTKEAVCPYDRLTAAFTDKDSAGALSRIGLNYLHHKNIFTDGEIKIKFSYRLQPSSKDLNLVIHAAGDRFVCHLQYSSELFDEELIQNFAEQFVCVLDKLCASDDITLTEAMALPEGQLRRLEELSFTAKEDVPVKLMHRMFERYADSYPDKTALIACDGVLSYGELEERANRIANALISRGFVKGCCAVLMLRRTSAYFAALFGVLKAGGAFIPTDPAYPEERIRCTVEDSEAFFIITDEAAPEYSNNITVSELLECEDASRPDTDVSPEDLAYMIYTSGSTGKPKGVMLRHIGICSFLTLNRANIQLSFACDDDAVYLSVSTVAFDLSFKEHCGTLCNGKTLVFASDEEMNNPKALAALIVKHRVTAINATPSRMTEYLKISVFEKALAGCRYVLCGGESYPLSLRDRLRSLSPDINIFNTYGPTEITVSSNTALLNNAEHINIGRPLLNYEEYIVDRFGELTPFGAAGELYIGGPGVAKGYKGLPEKTAASFVEYRGRRMYRSGDLAKWDSNGCIVILGRLDNQVKLRGLRIELGEIENVMGSFPHITEAAADVRNIGGTEHLVAYYTADADIDEDALKAHCASRLTHYMMPDAFMRTEKMPHSPNGKRTLKSLPDPVFRTSSNAAPRKLTVLERELCELAEKASGTPTDDVTSDLMRLGLTSLSVVSFASFCEEKYGAEIPVSRLMHGMSIIDIENIIYKKLTDKSSAEAEKAAVSEIGGLASAYPLSSNQLGVYYDLMKKPEETLYNMPICYRFENVDTERLRSALEKAVACHYCMNTHIAIRSGELVQIPDREHRAEIPVRDMTEEKFQAYKSGFVRPFDLHKDTLCRFEIVRTERYTYLLTDINHIVFDGISRGIFMNTVSKAYSGEDVKPEKTDQYRYALAEAEFRNSEEFQRSEQYFTDMMKDLESPSEIPADRSGRAEDGRLAVTSVTMDRKTVTDFCRANGITPSTLFLAAVFYTVSRFTGRKDVYISTISGGRSDPRFRGTVGMLVRTVPLHYSLNSRSKVTELLEAAARSMLDGIDNENYPFTDIADRFGYSTEIMYECQLGVSAGSDRIGDAVYTAEYMKLDIPKFKTAVAIEEHKDGIAVSVRYNDALYTAEYMETLAQCIKVCTEAIMKDTSAETGGISLLTEEEKRLTSTFETSQLEDTPVQLLHKMFEQQAARSPEKTALIACDRTFSYAKLDRAANIAANKLYARGVTAGGRVVLLLPRRSFFFISLLGVLKAGAAFIPCDPEYPAARIAHITGDSGASFIITTPEHLDDYPADKTIDIAELLGEGRDTPPEADITPESLAYLIYTSGSTGKPKGVMLRHAGICNYLYPHSGNILIKNIQERCRVYVSLTTVSFDMSMKEHLLTLCNGRTLVFANEEQTTDPRALTKLIKDTGADVVNITPSRLIQYLEYKPFAEVLGQLKTVACGGEPYPLSLRNRLRELTGAVLLNSYGPTEITVSSNAADLTEAEYISVGRPLPNYHEFIVDADGNLLPHGVIGELIIGGVGVAAGYNGLEEQTAERFGERGSIRIYKSGDLAKWDKQGNVIILGRKDGQIKLRGLRIEPDEIAGLIEKQPHINKAAVLVRKLNGTDNLCAYYTAARPVDASELKKTLAASLTSYMVPTAYMQLEAFPVSPNGKTDLKALPDPEAVLSGEYEPPANETEEYFCGLFAKVLGLERVGANDSFFELGGSSLLVMSVTVAAAENGYEITYGDVFRKPTPRSLARMFASGLSDEKVRIVDFEKYDYSKINELLSRNTMDSLLSGGTREVGNILLTGATGFMGSHVLYHFLKKETGKVYCLLRKGRFDDAYHRIKAFMFYYFDEDISENYSDRIEVFEGDVTDYKYFSVFKDLPIDTVFNCAANVKHFSNGTDIEDVNVGGAQNCVRFCLETGARLIHFSTVSVAGASADGKPPIHSLLDERTLYMGQRLDTKYSNSKLLSERVVLEAMAGSGLDAKVIRVGTLSARVCDGEVQINFLSNNFMGRLRSYVMLGVFPYSLMNSPVRLGPIDESVEAFFVLAKTPKECCLFNCTNSHSIPLSDIIREMQRTGLNVRFATEAEFEYEMKEAQKDPQKAAILSSMLAYRNMAHGKKLTQLRSSNDYTTQVLARMGFFWQSSSEKYLLDYINALTSLNFFNTSKLNR